MFARVRRLLARFFRRSRTINNEPLNRVSLIVIILIDIFILVSVFTGLDDISKWYISPAEAYPCYSEWNNYRTQTAKDKDYQIVKSSFLSDSNTVPNFQPTYQKAEEEHLGNVSGTCLEYASYKDKINSPENQKTIKLINQKQLEVNTLEQVNRNIRAQYDSTLLEKIAGQAPGKSINSVKAEKAKQQLDQNNGKISNLQKEISGLGNQLTAKPESTNFIAFLENDEKFRDVERGYQNAAFWHPSIQLVFQSLFLLPLILIALAVNKFAQKRDYGLIALISWHLLVIFLIPLILKVFEFLQIGALFQFIFDIVATLFGGLLFLISYVYILLIPLIGFAIIKFVQRVVLNTKAQASSRVQKSLCIKCAKRIQNHDTYCPHCGYHQYVECLNCHDLTYKHLPYCKQCGYAQTSNEL